MTYILLTNDDGVHAPGLYALAMAMQGLVEKVGVIAPIRKPKHGGTQDHSPSKIYPS
ncbi:MAG UNVERIFIED_CONTAM: 5'/3'-nucleotidase SurE [Anaerolineae bacterium]|jgi:broad specificity polyphosphatase/5'/3'-nucleotidase SurE